LFEIFILVYLFIYLKDISADWQQTACRVLISLCSVFPDICFDEIYKNVPQG
jgi:hypothetical protein